MTEDHHDDPTAQLIGLTVSELGAAVMRTTYHLTKALHTLEPLIDKANDLIEALQAAGYPVPELDLPDEVQAWLDSDDDGEVTDG